MTDRAEPEPFVVADVSAWRAWLDQNETASEGLWVMLAKKGTVEPTSLNYQDALEEALCSGWIDGQRNSIDAHTFKQRYTPRRSKSLWSLRNIEIVTRLTAEGRMRERGFAEIDRAKADGRWDRAYAGPAKAEVPDELAQALEAHPEANAAFTALNRTERYSALHPILTATTAATRTRRIERLLLSLQRR